MTITSSYNFEQIFYVLSQKIQIILILCEKFCNFERENN